MLCTLFSFTLVSYVKMLCEFTADNLFCFHNRKQGFKRLYTLKGGASHYLEREGSVGWVGNLFVFDARLSLPPSTYKPEVEMEASTKLEAPLDNSFAKCYICGSQVCELRHRNCANLDCNLLFL